MKFSKEFDEIYEKIMKAIDVNYGKRWFNKNPYRGHNVLRMIGYICYISGRNDELEVELKKLKKKIKKEGGKI